MNDRDDGKIAVRIQFFISVLVTPRDDTERISVLPFLRMFIFFDE